MKKDKFNEFRNILREILTEKQFNKYVLDIIDADEFCRSEENAFLNSDVGGKKDMLRRIKSYLEES